MAELEYYHFPHITRQDYDCAFSDACLWVLEHPDECPITAARIFHVKEDTLKKSVLRSEQKERNSKGVYNTHGGNNKILDEAQEEAIRQYCYEQWEMGLGASHNMVYAAISHLRQV